MIVVKKLCLLVLASCVMCLVAVPAVHAHDKVELDSKHPPLQIGPERQEACNDKQAGLVSTMQAGIQKRQAHLELFDAISQRVQTFYNNAQLESEKYAGILAATQSERQTAAQAINHSKNEITFDCRYEPHPQIEVYTRNLQAINTALHEYRVSLKELIATVRNASEK